MYYMGGALIVKKDGNNQFGGNCKYNQWLNKGRESINSRYLNDNSKIKLLLSNDFKPIIHGEEFVDIRNRLDEAYETRCIKLAQKQAIEEQRRRDELEAFEDFHSVIDAECDSGLIVINDGNNKRQVEQKILV